MQDAPDVDVIRLLPIEHQHREAPQRPDAQPFDAQFVCVARRAYARMPTDALERLLQSINKPKRKVLATLGLIVTDGVADVALRQRPRDDWTRRHAWLV